MGHQGRQLQIWSFQEEGRCGIGEHHFFVGLEKASGLDAYFSYWHRRLFSVSLWGSAMPSTLLSASSWVFYFVSLLGRRIEFHGKSAVGADRLHREEADLTVEFSADVDRNEALIGTDSRTRIASSVSLSPHGVLVN